MKVWLVETSVDYEGTYLQGIYDTEDKAKARVQYFESEKKKADESETYYASPVSTWWDSIDYYGVDVE